MATGKVIAAFMLIAIAAHQSIAIADEADRNRGIARDCKNTSLQYNDGDGQTTPICQMAIYHKCVAEGLRPYYPEKYPALRQRVEATCSTFSGLKAHASQPISCPACDPE